MFLILSVCLMLQMPSAAADEAQMVTKAELQAALAAQKSTWTEQAKALDAQLKELDLKAQKGDFELEKRVGYWDVYWYSVLTALGLGALGLFYKFWKLNTWIDNRLEIKFDDHTRHIYTMMDDRDIDAQLLKETRILLLNTDGNRQTLSRIKDWRFKQAWVKSIEEYEAKPNPDDYDLILFDRLDKEPIEAFLEDLPDKYFVGYSTEHLRGLDTKNRVNLANSSMTLLTRIMETARFMKLEKHAERMRRS